MNITRASLTIAATLTLAGTAIISTTPANATLPAKQKIPNIIVGSATAPEAGHISVRGIDVEIGATTEAGVRKAEGRKPNSFLPLMGMKGPVGKVMTYTFKLGKGKCEHLYGFPSNGGAVVEFTSTCPNTKTFNGAKIGMNVLKAEALTGVHFRFDGKIGDYTCMLDNPAMVQRGPGAVIIAWSNIAPASAGGTARIIEISAYGDNALTWQAGFCERTP